MSRNGDGWLAAGDHRPDFKIVVVGKHLIFGDQLIATNYQVRFGQEIELAQDVFCLLGAFDVYGSRRMAQLDAHHPIIDFRESKRQGTRSKGRGVGQRS